ncbi:MAG: hypothetical protein GWN79_13915, partial [Actinobacteria bacterium]|nr:hypothetical protein [Actinomycetota bacterium]NIS32730.1 hypothetical protein [Actinomycetota bacterium]NIT96408.1 hypothetical protein [Actinomycetota bacterium]NIU20116.1 hypothetical protein [Actinomycetota bacterium]NIV56582.1 hypothetical protein [Actinomycetota bacterium]
MIRWQRFGGALVAALLFTASAAAQEWPEVVVERDLMVTARDGVRLATDVYRPARDGVPARDRLPV